MCCDSNIKSKTDTDILSGELSWVNSVNCRMCYTKLDMGEVIENNKDTSTLCPGGGEESSLNRHTELER